ncbi:hypothetical protein NUW58_g5750 [Xylaria curta]|uniref:Uncharacterized protein n=1 Tax=Xylaria curta TaxID=42375 RepID=A0ACC1P353_9PEZI|nr:hypothetical protein NUW58_g5750 [Xylaria curta]
MDPLNAISLAAAVVQFTDFSVRFLSEAARVYKSASGTTSQAMELKTVDQDLRQLSRSIQEKSAQLADPRKPLRESEQKLLQLCRTCEELSEELVAVVIRLETQSTGGLNRSIESFGVADFRYETADDDGDYGLSLVVLNSLPLSTSIRCLYHTNWERREESKSGADDLDQLSTGQMDMLRTLARIDNTTHNLNQTLVKLMQGSTQVDWRQRDIIETIWSSSWSPQQQIRDISGGDVEFLEDDSNVNNDAACSKAILNSLFDKELRHREVAIPETYKSTFQWLLNSPRIDTHGRPLWSDFTVWLRNPNSDIYWVTGKPGSGKSTLMKFITDHSMVKEVLAQWSGTKPFILATFYFWNAGTSLQRTQEGLLRTLLHQCLTQKPQLIPKVCPRRWALFKVFGSKAVKAAPPWAWEELHESFSTFDLLAGEQFNLVLFIDGLDEFDGNHQNLLKFVRLLHSRVGRKVCVSGRPWNDFQDAFKASPSLRLESLTASDIRFYVQDNLESRREFRVTKASFHSNQSI